MAIFSSIVHRYGRLKSKEHKMMGKSVMTGRMNKWKKSSGSWKVDFAEPHHGDLHTRKLRKTKYITVEAVLQQILSIRINATVFFFSSTVLHFLDSGNPLPPRDDVRSHAGEIALRANSHAGELNAAEVTPGRTRSPAEVENGRSDRIPL